MSAGKWTKARTVMTIMHWARRNTLRISVIHRRPFWDRSRVPCGRPTTNIRTCGIFWVRILRWNFKLDGLLSASSHSSAMVRLIYWLIFHWLYVCLIDWLTDWLMGFFADNPHHIQQNHAPQTGGTRTNQQVEKLIARYEGPEFEEYLRLGNTIDIVDVRADDHLGPNPRATVMKQLTEQEANPPPRPMVVKGKVNKTAKQKGQITFLAAQAVARESELQNEWSRNRASRQAASSRYGFWTYFFPPCSCSISSLILPLVYAPLLMLFARWTLYIISNGSSPLWCVNLNRGDMTTYRKTVSETAACFPKKPLFFFSSSLACMNSEASFSLQHSGLNHTSYAHVVALMKLFLAHFLSRSLSCSLLLLCVTFYRVTNHIYWTCSTLANHCRIVRSS